MLELDYTKPKKSYAKQEAVSFHTGPHHHSIRGLSKLGHKCFFNSVLQNLLALKMLRESLLNPENSDPNNNVTLVMGPLTISLENSS
jgi:ubiquitin C-terminal hydrolase